LQHELIEVDFSFICIRPNPSQWR